MSGQANNTYHEQMQKIEKIANGVSLDVLANVMEVLRHRQLAAQQMVEALKVNHHGTPDCITYLNKMNDMIHELLITKL